MWVFASEVWPLLGPGKQASSLCCRLETITMCSSSSMEYVPPLSSGCSGSWGLHIEFILSLDNGKRRTFPLAFLFFPPFNKASKLGGRILSFGSSVLVSFFSPPYFDSWLPWRRGATVDLQIQDYLNFVLTFNQACLSRRTQVWLPVCECSSSTRGSKIINNSCPQSFMNHSSRRPCRTLSFAYFSYSSPLLRGSFTFSKQITSLWNI